MRIYLLCLLLTVAVNARPQTNITSDWKQPIEPPQQFQNHRYTNQWRGISRRASTFIPVDYVTHTANRITSKNNNTMRRKTHVKYTISNVSSLKGHANKTTALAERDKNILDKFIVSNIDNLNKTTKIRNKLTPIKENKHWPDSEINSAIDLSNYNNYISTTTPRPKKPLVQNIITKVAPNPVKNKHNGWQQIHLKPTREPTESNSISAQGSVPINIIENSHPYPFHVPAGNVHFETLVTLAPDAPLKDTNVENPCPVVTVTSNTIYNKELCPDLDIVINNHILTNTNIFTETPLVAEDDGSVDYAASSSDYDSVEVAAPPAADEALGEEPNAAEIGSDLAEVGIQADPEEIPLQEIPLEDGLGESVASSGTETQPSSSASQSGNRPQLPNLPQFPQNDNNNDDDGDGIFDLSFPNPLDYPFISFVLFPLAILLTGTLGVTTFFIPWTVFPTIFLSRNAKQADLVETPITRPDGWFWHEGYQSWANVHRKHENVSENRAFADNSVASRILRLIEEFGRKYNETTNKSWKRRKKN